MKHAENNEMDLLIRSLAQREGASSIRSNELTGDQAERAHLDADELNSYAEGTLPALTRARYTAHLADCSSCRRMVSQLAMSSGVGIPSHVVEAETILGFREKLRALFSPAVLRYAVPALVLFAVVAVGLVALRDQPLGDLAANRSSSTPTQEAHDTLSQPATTADSPAVATRSDESPDASVQKGKVAGENQQARVAGNAKAGEADAAADNKAVSGNTATAVSQPTFAPEPAAAPAPKAEANRTEAETAGAARRPAERTEEKREAPARDEQADRQRRKEDTAQTTAEDKEKLTYSKDGTQSAKSADSLRASQGLRRSDEKKADDDGAEIRTVSGRRFRKQGNAWIDTAYQSSATTLVTRGSEQYRALIADEPGIRTIAEQLSGEVVLVWKGRAYRIR